MRSLKFFVALFWVFIASLAPARAQGTYTKLATFTCFYGQCQPGLPISGLLEVSPGTFAGSLTFGVIYTVTSAQQFQILYSLPSAIFSDAGTPFQASDGNLYIPSTFNFTPSVYKYDLQAVPDRFPVPVLVGASPLIEAGNLTLYGTSVPANTFSPIYSLTFDGQTQVIVDVPQSLNSVQTLLQASDGHLYGLTGSFVGDGASSLIRIDPGPAVTTLATFAGVNGKMIEASDGNFYGCAYGPGAGSLYRLTKSGAHTTIYAFTGGADGANPAGCGIQASDGKLYGTTGGGGANGYGTIFQSTLAGQVAAVYSFTGGDQQQRASQYSPALNQGSDGKLYGMTTGPYANSPGENIGATIFSLDLGLPKPQPGITRFAPFSGSPGDSVLITGRNLLGAIAVSFNGAPAAFTLKSGRYLEAVVPAGATTGLLTITTPNGTGTSKLKFHVK